jgi:hypothetical protein
LTLDEPEPRTAKAYAKVYHDIPKQDRHLRINVTKRAVLVTTVAVEKAISFTYLSNKHYTL